jgi:hypothetical protein
MPSTFPLWLTYGAHTVHTQLFFVVVLLLLFVLPLPSLAHRPI